MGKRIYLDQVVLYKELDTILSELPVGSMDAFEISGDRLKYIGFRSFTSKSYPEFDVCDGLLEQTFDMIICEQIFEHLLYPHRAAKKIFSNVEAKRVFPEHDSVLAKDSQLSC